jgi:hypothetical protein
MWLNTLILRDALKKICKTIGSGVDVMVTIFGDFCQFSAIFANFRRKKWRLSQKNNVTIKFFHIVGLF